MATNEPKYVTEPILTYYDAKIKKYIDEKAIQPQVELERRLDAVEKEAAVNATNITAHREELDDLEQDVRDLRAAIENSCGGSGNCYVTKEYVDSAIETAIDSLNIPDTDNLVTKDELNSALEELPTEEDLKRLTEVVANVEASLEEKANREDIPSLEGLATEQFVTEAIAAIPPVDLSDYARKTDVPSIEGLASETYVDEKVASIDIPEVPTKVSELENDAGYITQHQDISHLATKTEVNNLSSVTSKVKYEVLPVDNMIVGYNDNEVRINTENIELVKQTSGATADVNGYYVGFKAYAPEGCVAFRESLDSTPTLEDTTIFTFDDEFAGTDEFGRKYSIVWLKAATYDEASATWINYGLSATAEKCLGYYYTVEWLDESNKVISSDCIRIVFTNDAYHYSDVSDAVNRRLQNITTNIENT